MWKILGKLPWLVLGAGLVATYAWQQTAQQDVREILRITFDDQARRIAGLLEKRMMAHENMLHGVAGLFAASQQVTPAGFHDYVASLQVEEYYPGLQGIGFARLEDRQPWHTRVVHLEPPSAEANWQTPKDDLSHASLLREAMAWAWTAGKVALSGRVPLAEASHPGLFLFMPVYRNGLPHATLEERQSNLSGWVFALFRVHDLIADILDEGLAGLDLELFDGDQVSLATLMFDLDNQPFFHCESLFALSLPMQLAGHRWTLRIHSLPEFENSLDNRRPILQVGLWTSVLLSLLVWLLSSRLRISHLAQDKARALEESEFRWKFAIEGAGDALWDWNGQTGAVYFSKRWKEMLGFADDEIGNNLSEWEKLIHPEDLIPTMAAMQDHFNNKTPSYVSEHRMLCKDGSWKWILARGMLVSRTEDGKPLRMIGTHSDISDRRKAFEDLSRSETRFRTLYDSTRDAVMLLDENGFFDCNQATLKMFGCATEAEFYAKHPADLSPAVQPGGTDSVTLSKQYITRALNEGSLYFEWMHARVDTGRTFHAEVLLSAMELDGRRILQAVIRDISVRKQAEAALRESEEKLRKAQKMEAIGLLTGGIAHDFNNILAGILGYTELAINRFATDESTKLHRYLRNIQSAGFRAKELVAQMLAFSRGQESAIQQVAIVTLVKEVIKLVRATFPSSIAIVLDFEDETSTILSDPVQCHQVLLNLLVNARDAMQDKGRLELTITRENAGTLLTCSSCHAVFAATNMVGIAVRDSGSGIAPEILDKIFQPFFTTKDVGKGSGMGLAVIHGILHNQQAHLVVSSQPGVGTEFRLFFPAVGKETQAVKGQMETRIDPNNLTGRILVVDDEKAVVEFLREFLEDMGLSIIPFTGSQAALAFFRANPQAIDLVITDQTMPEMTGVELVRAMHAVRQELPVIMCTGFSRDVDERSASRLGIHYFLTKPIEIQQLTLALNAVLTRPSPSDP